MAVARHADIAADALADVVDPAFLNLFGQERVGDGGVRRPDHVEPLLFYQSRHGIRRGVASHTHNGLGRHLFDKGDIAVPIP